MSRKEEMWRFAVVSKEGRDLQYFILSTETTSHIEMRRPSASDFDLVNVWDRRSDPRKRALVEQSHLSTVKDGDG